MRRRNFILLLGCAAATRPQVGHARQSERMRHVGVLINLAADDPEGQARLNGFVRELEQLGWKVGHNLSIEARNAGDAETGMSSWGPRTWSPKSYSGPKLGGGRRR